VANACVLYLMPSDRLWLDAKLETAQQDALKQRLPLATVTCIVPEDYIQKLQQLHVIESQLEKYNIPLIVLIGTEATTLPSLVKHSKPVHVYGHGSERAGKPVSLQPHPHKWPGIVIKTDELKKIVDKDAYMC
jgi:hypothetical protein